MSKKREAYTFKSAVRKNQRGNFYFLEQDQFFIREKYSVHSPIMGLYQTFSKLDLFEMKRIEKAISEKKLVKSIDYRSILAAYERRSIFSLFDGNIMLLQTILQVIGDKDFKDDEDRDETVIDNPVL